MGAVQPSFQRKRGGDGGPGGWWIATEVEIALETSDVAIPYYWIADPRDCTLTVLRWSADGYVTRLRAARHEVVRAEPFDALELSVGRSFGDDPAE